ncbi:DeSI-like protein [Nymphaea thermarum]|nr:DeSI-like protein [Nymphaea thermarum]
MVSPLSKSASEGSDETQNAQLVLNVYDLTPINNYMCWFGVGIYHSGIEAYGMEYGFGAHDYPTSGVFQVEPKCCPGYIYRCTIPLGNINMTQSEVQTFMEHMASKYHGDTYHLISKNCNHFTDDVCMTLTGRSIPGWVNRLARLGALCNCLLPESLQVTTVRHVPEYHGCSEEESESPSPIITREATESEDGDPERQLLSSPTAELEFIRESPK